MEHEQISEQPQPVPQPRIVPLFPAAANPIIIPDDLAIEFLGWVNRNLLSLRPDDVVNRLAARIEKQLNRS